MRCSYSVTAVVAVREGTDCCSVEPISARAQQSAMPVVGLLNSASPDGYALMLAAFRQGLKEAGYVEDRGAAASTLAF